MTQQNQLKLTREQLVAIYNKVFEEEYEAMVVNVRSLAKGNAAFANSWKNWLSIGSISASVIAVNAVFAVLAALTIVSGFVTLGVGIALAVAGLVGGILYQIHAWKKNIKRYQDADSFLKTELTSDNLASFRTKLLDQLYPAIKDSSAKEINTIIKTVISALENLIVNKQINSFSDLDAKSIADLLLESAKKTPVVIWDTKMINAIIAKLPATVAAKTSSSGKLVSGGTADVTLAVNTVVTKQSMWGKSSHDEQESQNGLVNQMKGNSLSL